MSTHQENAAKVKDMANQLVEVARTSETHRIALSALLTAFAAMAVCHPCCAHSCADQAREMADFIETHAAPEGAAHLH